MSGDRLGILLPQLVPSQVCLSCDVCCRFPDRDSFLRPYFTAEEIQRAVARGIDRSHFPDPSGCQIALTPHPSGEGYLCPAFDPTTSHCRIYEDRPLDCQIYPLAVMWAPPTAAGEEREARDDRQESSPLPMARSPLAAASAEKLQVVLGWDTKCPYLRGSSQFEVRGFPSLYPSPLVGEGRGGGALAPEIVAYADRIAEWIERDDVIETFARHPRLIGRFQEDVVILRSLPKLTERLRGPFDVRSSKFSRNLEPRTSNFQLRPLTVADHGRFRQALADVETPLAHYALAPHLLWRNLFAYSWAEMEGCFCLFAEYADGLYMPLPPLPLTPTLSSKGRGGLSDSLPPGGRGEGEGSPRSKTGGFRPDRLAPALAACFALMRERNRGSAVSRIENVPEEWAAGLEALGYRVKPKDPDYLYRTADLVALAGDRYKSQRAACNRVVREHRPSFEPYRDTDREECLALFHEWVAQKRASGLEEAGRLLLADSEAAHREALAHHRELGLIGYVVRVDGRICGYTFGYERSSSVFCVLLEVTDRTVPGLAAFLFREYCQKMDERGYEFINTMDDSGLASLAQSKRAYHPVRLVPSYVVTEA